VARRLGGRHARKHPRCLTPPSSGRQKGCAFLPPLMSNVRQRKVKSRERPVLARRVVGSALVVAIRVASAARTSAALHRAGAGQRGRMSEQQTQRLGFCKVCARTFLLGPQSRGANVRTSSASCAAPALQALRVRSAVNVRANRAWCLKGRRVKMRSVVQCMGRRQATQTTGSAWRRRQEYRPVQTALPNPSIERTPYGTLRVPPVAAHVERCASRLVKEVLCRA
jgi:hypothetical protein